MNTKNNLEYYDIISIIQISRLHRYIGVWTTEDETGPFCYGQLVKASFFACDVTGDVRFGVDADAVHGCVCPSGKKSNRAAFVLSFRAVDTPWSSSLGPHSRFWLYSWSSSVYNLKWFGPMLTLATVSLPCCHLVQVMIWNQTFRLTFELVPQLK